MFTGMCGSNPTFNNYIKQSLKTRHDLDIGYDVANTIYLTRYIKVYYKSCGSVAVSKIAIINYRNICKHCT